MSAAEQESWGDSRERIPKKLTASLLKRKRAAATLRSQENGQSSAAWSAYLSGQTVERKRVAGSGSSARQSSKKPRKERKPLVHVSGNVAGTTTESGIPRTPSIKPVQSLNANVLKTVKERDLLESESLPVHSTYGSSRAPPALYQAQHEFCRPDKPDLAAERPSVSAVRYQAYPLSNTEPPCGYGQYAAHRTAPPLFHSEPIQIPQHLQPIHVPGYPPTFPGYQPHLQSPPWQIEPPQPRFVQTQYQNTYQPPVFSCGPPQYTLLPNPHSADVARPAQPVIDLTGSDDDDAPEMISAGPRDAPVAEMLQREHETPISWSPANVIYSAAPPMSQITEPIFQPQVLGTCSCKEAVVSGQDSVFCANQRCAILTFHKPCVGVSKSKASQGWRCWQCRPKTALTVPAAVAAQRAASPPTMEFVPYSKAIPTTRDEPEPPLYPEQVDIISAIERGNNVFYTGSAGTGKSTVLKAFTKALKAQGKHVDIIAPSGIAAHNVGGMTFYAYAGWYPDSFKDPLHEFLKKSWGRKVRRRLCETDVLVIDEISMVDRDLLHRLDMMMREVRQEWRPERGEKRKSNHHVSLPFGGAQIIVTGDFCQLPPVKPFRYCMFCGGDDMPGHKMQDGRPITCVKCKRVYKDEEKWAFCADVWKACRFQYFELKHIHRQSDKTFIDILQKCRYGKPLDVKDQALLLTPKPDPIGAVKLLPRRAEVATENSRNFQSLKSPIRKYECHDDFMWQNRMEPDLQSKSKSRYPHRPDGPLEAQKDHRFDEDVELKEGMLVILLVNLDFTTGLVNGSQGRIIGFEKHSDAKVFPPKEPGSPGPSSSLSRKKTQEKALQSAREAIIEDEIRAFIAKNKTPQWPIVEFQNGHVQPIYAACQISEHGSEKPYSLLCRTQIPMIAAWAITVHKSQGMTLNRVIVDLYNSFEREMVYVALSRARSLEGLKVLRLARSLGEGGVNEQVQGFLRAHGLGGV